jgi:site-specific DNA recombinase
VGALLFVSTNDARSEANNETQPEVAMITCAIYARKSTEQNGVADEAKSVTRQTEHARAYALEKGWIVMDEHVYVDDGTSGAEFSNRPGFVRLMNALRPRAPFGALIVSEVSRLGREQLETGYAVKQLSQAGVKIISYLDQREILLDTPTDKFLMSAVNFVDEMKRERSRQRVTDAMIRRARAGFVTGGTCFGYDNIRKGGPDGHHSHVERSINEREAEVVRRIFHLCASGSGIKAIAKYLNVEGVPSPRPIRGRPKGWAPSSVRSVLHRRTYVGEIRYGMTKTRDQWGQRRTQKRPASDVVIVTQPAWRIISDAEWQAAHSRLTPPLKPTLGRRTESRGAGPQRGSQASTC